MPGTWLAGPEGEVSTLPEPAFWEACEPLANVHTKQFQEMLDKIFSSQSVLSSSKYILKYLRMKRYKVWDSLLNKTWAEVGR